LEPETKWKSKTNLPGEKYLLVENSGEGRTGGNWSLGGKRFTPRCNEE